jgi:hypothetical protein
MVLNTVWNTQAGNPEETYKGITEPTIVDYTPTNNPDFIKWLGTDPNTSAPSDNYDPNFDPIQTDVVDPRNTVVDMLVNTCKKVSKSGEVVGDINQYFILESFQNINHFLVVYTPASSGPAAAGAGPQKGITLSGFAILRKKLQEVKLKTKKTLTIKLLYIEVFCGSGYGEILMNKIKEIAKEEKVAKITLFALNPELAKKVYTAKYGFQPIKEISGGVQMEYLVPSGGSRFQKQTRRSKRHTRNYKGRKLGKLTTRRR